MFQTLFILKFRLQAFRLQTLTTRATTFMYNPKVQSANSKIVVNGSFLFISVSNFSRYGRYTIETGISNYCIHVLTFPQKVIKNTHYYAKQSQFVANLLYLLSNYKHKYKH